MFDDPEYDFKEYDSQEYDPCSYRLQYGEDMEYDLEYDFESEVEDQQELRRCPGGTLYVVRRGDTLIIIAQRFNTTVRAIILANPGIDPDRLIPGTVICIPGARPPIPPRRCPRGTFPYRVRFGDTLQSIARRFRTTVREILRVNPGLDRDRIFPGQRICIPFPRPIPRSEFD